MNKALSFGYKKFAIHDGDGIRTTLFLSGCPLSCAWCHNVEGKKACSILGYFEHKCINCGECVKVCKSGAHFLKDGVHIFDRKKCVLCGKCEKICLGDAIVFYGKEISPKQAVELFKQDKDFYGELGGATLSGGECLIWPDFCFEVAKLLQEEKIGLDIDTSAFVQYEYLQRLIPFVDKFLIDIKAINDEIHKKITGVSNKIILENIIKLVKEKANIEIRVPLIPTINDNEMKGIAKFIADVGIEDVRILPYHNFYFSKADALGIKVVKSIPLPSANLIEETKQLFKMQLLNVK